MIIKEKLSTFIHVFISNLYNETTSYKHDIKVFYSCFSGVSRALNIKLSKEFENKYSGFLLVLEDQQLEILGSSLFI